MIEAQAGVSGHALERAQVGSGEDQARTHEPVPPSTSDHGPGDSSERYDDFANGLDLLIRAHLHTEVLDCVERADDCLRHHAAERVRKPGSLARALRERVTECMVERDWSVRYTEAP